MSYAGVYGPDETCKHGNYYRNCIQCADEALVKRGTRDENGVLHSDNGAGWCVARENKKAHLVRHCPVLNTPEQLAENLREDKLLEIKQATDKVYTANSALVKAENELARAKRELLEITNN